MSKAEKKKPVKTAGNTKNSESIVNIVNPHDKVIKDYLSEKETFASLLQHYLPPRITRNLDFNTLEITKDNFVKELSDYFSDLLYQINLKNGTKAFIYVLIEHKSWKDPFVAFQLLKYLIRIWELFKKQNKDAKKLPVILPIVIYHGKSKWKIEKNFISLFEAPEYVKEFVPDFNFNVQDISHTPDEQIKGTIKLRILFLTLKYIFNPKLIHKLPGIFRLAKTVWRKERGTEYLGALLRYLSKGAPDLPRNELNKMLTQVFELEGGKVMATVAEQYMQEGEKRGEKRIARELMKNGVDINLVIKSTGLTREEVEKLAETVH